MVLRRRHLVKALTWRICDTIATVLVTIIITMDVVVGLMVGPIDFIIKVVLYYVHEVCWLKIKF